MTDDQQSALDQILTGALPWVTVDELDPAVLAELVAAGWLTVWPEAQAVTLTPWAAQGLGKVLVERVVLVEWTETVTKVERVGDGRRRRRQVQRTIRAPEDVPHWEGAERVEHLEKTHRPIRLRRERGVGHRPEFWWASLVSRDESPELAAEIQEAATAVLQSDLDPEWGDQSPVTLFGDVPLMRTAGKGWHGAGRRTAV